MDLARHRGLGGAVETLGRVQTSVAVSLVADRREAIKFLNKPARGATLADVFKGAST